MSKVINKTEITMVSGEFLDSGGRVKDILRCVEIWHRLLNIYLEVLLSTVF